MNEVGNKTTITYFNGYSPDDSGVIIEKTGHFIDRSKLILKCIVQSSYSDGQPTKSNQSDTSDS